MQDEAERMYVLEETVLCMVESLHFLRKLCNVVRSETGEAHLRNLSECRIYSRLLYCNNMLGVYGTDLALQRGCVEDSRLLVQEYNYESDFN